MPPSKSVPTPAASRFGNQLSFPPGAIDSLEAADEILLALVELRVQHRQLQALCDDEVAGITGKYARQMVVVVEGQIIPFADRETTLVAALTEFAHVHQAEILDGSKKSRELNHGILKWASTREKLVPVDEGGSVAGNSKVLDGFFAFLIVCLGKAAKLGCKAAELAGFIRPQVAFDKVALLTAVKQKKITPATLKKAGFQIAPKEDRFEFELKLPAIESQPSATTPASES